MQVACLRPQLVVAQRANLFFHAVYRVDKRLDRLDIALVLGAEYRS